MMRFNAILFNIVEQCNIRCRHCGYADSLRDSTVSEIDLINWVTQAVDYGIRHIIFTGGEPFIKFNLLKTGFEAVAQAGGTSGVFTNSSWAKSLQDAKRILGQLPQLTELFLSFDKYHQEFVPLDKVLYAVEAARELEVPSVIICITYATESDKREVTDLFSCVSDYVKFYHNRVIRSDYVALQVPDASVDLKEFVPENFGLQCYLHTPLVNPTGTVAACHIGKEETHGDFSQSPYYLGNLHQENLANIFARSEDNCVYQYLRVNGPQAIVAATLATEKDKSSSSNKFVSDCEMCFRLLSEPYVYDELKSTGEQTSDQESSIISPPPRAR
jgi:hypothetical protein